MSPLPQDRPSASSELPDELEQPRAKRKRAAYSCTECSKAKAKCNRQHPCSRCIDRRIPGMCYYLISGHEDPLETSKDIRERLMRIERLLLESRSDKAGQPARDIDASIVRQTGNGHRESDVGVIRGGFMAHGRYYGPSAMSHVGEGARSDIMRALKVPDPESPQVPGNTRGQRIPKAVIDILHEFPEKSVCDELVRLYFEHINLTRYPVNRESFMITYDSLWSTTSMSSLEPAVIHRLPLVLIILATSTLSAPDSALLPSVLTPTDGRQQRLVTATELFNLSRRASAESDALVTGKGDMLIVVSDILAARFLILAHRATDALPLIGAAVSRAQAMGLHRTARIVGHLSPVEKQGRRLVWSHVYHMNRYCALLLGQPLGFSDDSCDAEMPLNLDETNVEQPLSELTRNSFLIHRHELARIMSRISSEVFALAQPSYQTICAIDDEMEAWAARLPPAFRPQQFGEDKRGYLSDAILAIHQYLLLTEYHYVKTTLHRPYIFLQDPQNIHGRSREACLQAAMADLWERTKFSPPPGIQTLSTGSYRVANSLIILGITMLRNPPIDVVLSIQQCLAQFAATRRDQRHVLDHIRIKEMAMIEMLQDKAEAAKAASRAPSPPGAFESSDSIFGFAQPTDPTGLNGHTAFDVDPSLQAFLDQFWGPSSIPELDWNGGVTGDLGGQWDPGQLHPGPDGG